MFHIQLTCSQCVYNSFSEWAIVTGWKLSLSTWIHTSDVRIFACYFFVCTDEVRSRMWVCGRVNPAITYDTRMCDNFAYDTRMCDNFTYDTRMCDNWWWMRNKSDHVAIFSTTYYRITFSNDKAASHHHFHQLWPLDINSCTWLLGWASLLFYASHISRILLQSTTTPNLFQLFILVSTAKMICVTVLDDFAVILPLLSWHSIF